MGGNDQTPAEEHGADRRYAILEAPSNLGLRPTGVERLSAALLDLGLAERIGARRATRLEPLPYRHERDPATLVLNARSIADWSPHLADAMEDLLERGEFPVILGGDCSILLGSMLALRRRGRFGLLFVDGHADFYQPSADPTGEAASMELGFVTGHGPSPLTDLEGRRPLVRASDVVAFGIRDAEEQVKGGSQPLPAELRQYSLETIRRLGAPAAASEAIGHLTGPELDGFLIHVDADCLDDAVMPAVDYRLPDGLSWDELRATLTTALGTGRVIGLEVTVYNPNLDADGAAGRGLTDLLSDVL